MNKSEVLHPAVSRGRTWHRRLSTLIRKHPRPLRAPTPPRASSAPPSRIPSVPSSRTPTPALLTPATTADSTDTTTPDQYVAYEAEWSTLTPSTGYEETEGSTAVTSVAPVEVMRVLEHAFRPVEQRPLMVDLEEGMEDGLRKTCAFFVEVAQGTGVIGSSARVSAGPSHIPNTQVKGCLLTMLIGGSAEAQHTRLLEAR